MDRIILSEGWSNIGPTNAVVQDGRGGLRDDEPVGEAGRVLCGSCGDEFDPRVEIMECEGCVSAWNCFFGDCA